MITMKVNGVIPIITLSIISTGVRGNQTEVETILQYMQHGTEDGMMIAVDIPIILFAINHLMVTYSYPVIIFLKKLRRNISTATNNSAATNNSTATNNTETAT